MASNKIHNAVRHRDAVYMPDNEDHADWLAQDKSLRGPDRRRLLDCGAVSGPGFEKGADPYIAAEDVTGTEKMPEPPPPPEAVAVDTAEETTSPVAKQSKEPMTVDSSEDGDEAAPWNPDDK